MAEVSINPVVVHRLVLDALIAAATGLNPAVGVYRADEFAPDTADVARWVRLLRVDLGPGRRNTGKDADTASVTVSVQVGVGTRAFTAAPFALEEVCRPFRAALAQAGLVDSPLTHRVELETPDWRVPPQADEQSSLRTGVLTVSGMVTRASGNS